MRLDDQAERALRTLEAAGMTRSEAIRSALVAAAQRLRHRQELAAEAAALETDEADRQEMLSIASFMESLRAARCREPGFVRSTPPSRHQRMPP